jgi:hypothetical protein
MSHFYGNMQGNRGETTRGGSKDSGITAHLRGWHIGAKVYVDQNTETGEDQVTVTITGGSKDGGIKKHLGTYTLKELNNE